MRSDVGGSAESTRGYRLFGCHAPRRTPHRQCQAPKRAPAHPHDSCAPTAGRPRRPKSRAMPAERAQTRSVGRQPRTRWGLGSCAIRKILTVRGADSRQSNGGSGRDASSPTPSSVGRAPPKTGPQPGECPALLACWVDATGARARSRPTRSVAEPAAPRSTPSATASTSVYPLSVSCQAGAIPAWWRIGC